MEVFRTRLRIKKFKLPYDVPPGTRIIPNWIPFEPRSVSSRSCPECGLQLTNPDGSHRVLSYSCMKDNCPTFVKTRC